jgi:hypothetical protein
MVVPEHDRVGTGSTRMDVRGYVLEEPAVECEGTCARDCNHPIMTRIPAVATCIVTNGVVRVAAML